MIILTDFRPKIKGKIASFFFANEMEEFDMAYFRYEAMKEKFERRERWIQEDEDKLAANIVQYNEWIQKHAGKLVEAACERLEKSHEKAMERLIDVLSSTDTIPENYDGVWQFNPPEDAIWKSLWVIHRKKPRRIKVQTIEVDDTGTYYVNVQWEYYSYVFTTKAKTEACILQPN